MVEHNTDEQETVEISASALATLTNEANITLTQMKDDDATPAAIIETVEQAFDEANSVLDDSVYSPPTRNAASEADALVEALEEADELDAQMKEEDDEVDNWEPDFLK